MTSINNITHTLEKHSMDVDIQWVWKFNGCEHPMDVSIWAFNGCENPMDVDIQWMWKFNGCGNPMDVSVSMMFLKFVSL